MRWTRCSHRKTSTPVTEQRTDNVINRMVNAYVLCQECGQRIPYSLGEGRRLDERRKAPEDGGSEGHFASANGGASSLPAQLRSNPADGFWAGMSSAIRRKPTASPSARPQASASPTAASHTRKTPASGIALTSIASLHKLAVAYHAEKKYDEAERIYREMLLSLTAAPPTETRDTELAQLLNNLGRLYFDQGRHNDAEPLYARSLALLEQALGPHHPKVARRLVNLAELYFATGKHSRAEEFFRRAVSIEEKVYGSRHPNTLKRLQAFAALLRRMNRLTDAEAVERYAALPATKPN